MPEEQWIETENEHEWRQGVFASDDCQEVLVEIPEWRRKVIVKQLVGSSRFDFIAWQLKLEQDHPQHDGLYFRKLYFELALRGCIHPRTKKPVFKPADRDTLNDDHNGAVIQMLGETVQIFSNLDGSTRERAKKNLSSTLNSSATTSLRNGSTSSESATLSRD